MADTTFTNGVTLTDAGWFNDANTVTYKGATDKILVGGGVGTVASWTTATGTGAPVRATTPTLVTPVLGVATATSVNKVAITAPATGSTITVLDGKTLTLNNTITFTGTDSTTMTFPSTSASIARTDAANTFTGNQTFLGTVSGNAAMLSPITASLGGDVALNNTANYFDGPSVAQGSTGTWFVMGQVTVRDTAGAAGIRAKLWDGTTVINSAYVTVGAANFTVVITLSGYITSPASNLKISVRDESSTSGSIMANSSANSKDSTITAFRIG